MKRLLSIIAIISVVFIQNLSSNVNILQDEMEETEVQEAFEDTSMAVEEVVDEPEQLNFHQELKKRFIEGGPGFMGIVLLCLILGLAIAIERIIYLNLSES
ncbi:MAG TPA: MotA/TolQ/ExbB proton channel family protein, partial [Flavobacteriaceae bacterium]|nr:MotA/TolQ/ExbB proton channel family protein [Flavobacteriaceae bacterium]